MHIFSRTVVRLVAPATRAFLPSTRQSTARLLSTRAVLPRSGAISVAFSQRRLNTDQAAPAYLSSNAEESGANDLARAAGEADQSQPERAAEDVSENTALFIGNIFFDVNETDVRDLFAKYGTVTECRIVKDIRGFNKGYGFVGFSTHEEAANALEQLNGLIFSGRRMMVNWRNSNSRPSRATGLPSSDSIYIGNIAHTLTDRELNSIFRPLRGMRDVRVAIDRRTGQPMGYAHADFYDVQCAREARALLEGREVQGRRLFIDYSESWRVRLARRGKSAPPAAVPDAVEGES